MKMKKGLKAVFVVTVGILWSTLIWSGCDNETKTVDACGDGFVDPGEECDGSTHGETCASLGYYETLGTLRCTAGCRWDATECGGRCGDGVLMSPQEDCEGINLNGQTCETQGHYPGTLACDGCAFDFFGCGGRCGDGIIQEDQGETCDGTALDDQTCETQGFHRGALSCTAECVFDLTDCQASGWCGDGVLQETFGEACDGENLGDVTCQTLGFGPGQLACADDCTINPAGCPARWSQVSAGWAHTCGIQIDGTLWCWGANYNGQLGLGHTSPPGGMRPQAVGLDADWRQVVCGYGLSCGLRTDGTLWCWGLFYGNVPTRVGADTNWTRLDLRSAHTFGLRTDGTLWCWGENSRGQLGLGDLDNRSEPTRVGADADWADLSTGNGHTCAIKSDGGLWCWGANDVGNLGVGDTTDRVIPTRVGTGTEWTEASLGYPHACALMADRSLWCWGGSSGSSELGVDPSGIVIDTPMKVGTDLDWEALATGYQFSCGIKTNHALWCWGNNIQGQLGIGFGASALPTLVGPDWVSVSTGRDHTCGIRLDGTLWCWGDNLIGQLGLDDFNGRDTPHLVLR